MPTGPGSVVAVIPARAGSRGIPGKNLARVGGRTLIERAVTSALRAQGIDSVYVSTDGDAIAAAAEAAGASVIRRPAGLAGDTTSSEAALLHALDALEADGVHPSVLVFIQATSPFIEPDDLDDAVRRVQFGESDVVVAAAESHAFLWKPGPDGAVAVNHDSSVRQRRQDREPEYRETGAFYAMDAVGFRRAGHRFFGRVGLAMVEPRDAVDIDTAADLELAGLLALSRTTARTAAGQTSSTAPRPDAIDVDALVTDFDGVHTDDRAVISADGVESVIVNRRDGHGVSLLRSAGIPVLILSTEQNPVVARRASKLQVEVLQGIDDKAAALAGWAQRRGLPLDRIAYLGNDVNDLPALKSVGWPVAVRDAHPLVLAAARHVLTGNGGDGAVRELADLILDERSRTA
jgi:N-acylneuraminate cytidylyltransferase